MYCVYFAKSLKNGKIYVGYTGKDPQLRVKDHNQGSNSWSKNNRPLKLIYFENYIFKEDALLREKFYKSGIGKAIKNLISDNIEKILGS